MSVNLPQPPLQESKLELTTRREGLTVEHKGTGCSMLGPPTLREGGGGKRGGREVRMVILQHRPGWRAGPGAEAAEAETGQGWVMSHGMTQESGA